MKRILLILITFFVFLSAFCEVKLIEYYPKILTLNNDNINERLFFKYFNDEGKELVVKIYDIKGILVDEEKITGSLKEKPQEDGSYLWYWSPLKDNLLNSKLLQGCYLFILLDKEGKSIYKGSIIMAR